MKIAFSRVSLSALGMTANADDLLFELRDREGCGFADVWEGEHGLSVTFGGVELDQQQADAHGRRLVATHGVVMEALCSGALRAFIGGDNTQACRLPADYWCVAQSFSTYSPPDDGPWPVEMAGESVIFVDAEMRLWARTKGVPEIKTRLGVGSARMLTAGAENKALDWLLAEVAKLDSKTTPKATLRKLCFSKVSGLSDRAFERAWGNMTAQNPEWRKGGRKLSPA